MKMGATFQSMTVDGSVQRNDVKVLFENAQESDRYENGHSYSGGFGMATGLVFENRTFDSAEEAEEYLAMTSCQKWEDAKCVTFKDKDGKAKWLIGAWCAS